MKRFLTVLFALLIPISVFAQQGGPVTIKAVDSASPAATFNVGNQSDSSLRIHIVGSDVSTGGASSADGATWSAGSTNGTPAMGARDDASPGTVAEDKLGVVRITTNRAMHMNLRNSSGTELGDATTPLQVSLANTGSNATAVAVSLASVPSHAVTNAGTFAVQAAQSGTWTIQPGNTANTTQWLVKSGPFDGCGTTTYDPTPALIADNTLDVLTATTTCVDTIVVANVGASEATITVQDTQGTPVQFVKAVPVAPGASMVISGLGGVKFASGIKYQASAANLLSIWVKGRQ